MEKSKIKKILYIILIMSWMLVIFAFSNLQATDSSEQSMTLSVNIVKGGAEFLHKIGIFKEMPSDEELNNAVEMIHNPIRKCAHAAEYFVLTFFIVVALRDKDCWNFSIKKAFLIAIGICFLYSLTDEFHQIFIPGRSGELTDCINDTLGGCVALVFYYICHLIKSKIKK